jgi:hypothetical protein
MGTRSLTVLYDVPRNDEKEGEEIAVLYRQFDGYPDGHGAELNEFLKDMVIVNGISMSENRRIANGGSCLAAQIVAHFKTKAGGFYLHPAGTRGAYEEYIYYVRPQKDGTIQVNWEEA